MPSQQLSDTDLFRHGVALSLMLTAVCQNAYNDVANRQMSSKYNVGQVEHIKLNNIYPPKNNLPSMLKFCIFLFKSYIIFLYNFTRTQISNHCRGACVDQEPNDPSGFCYEKNALNIPLNPSVSSLLINYEPGQFLSCMSSTTGGGVTHNQSHTHRQTNKPIYTARPAQHKH